ncbi:S66 peptidase family protein [Clostridium tarantellae]|uniref:LD-carboxypeptidase n=1 Tax=Clostridium tarantellae TaxID=39493 RepID=A0A6I1MM23_9CLOT|nr:LD-carboxypeptidase [Clostridium tarantellae]MPQ44546.1 LD-carboxypeptidase [Clostridium tarantellae]
MIANKLNFGDTIGVICPASGEKDQNFIDINLNRIKNLGFKIKEGKFLRYNSNNYLAAPDKERAEDFMNMFLDPKVKAIICYRGGYGSIRMLNYIKWDIIKHNPKIFCGYSDITLILNCLNIYTDLITFHSPMINSNFENKLTKTYFLNILMNGLKDFSIDLISLPNIKIFNEAQVKGKLCGGNLSIICSSLGTPYEINTKNKILFLEDVNEKDYSIDRMLTQLLLSNKLKNCKAFIIGHFTPNNNNEVILSLLKPLKKPILMNFPAGHDYPNITLPIGAEIYLDFFKGKIKFCNDVVNIN